MGAKIDFDQARKIMDQVIKFEKACQSTGLPPMQGVTIVKHPLVQHKLSLMRDKARSTSSFRRLVREIAMLLAYEVTRELPMTTRPIETPLEAMDAPTIDGKKLVLAPILRAGLALAEGMMELIPSARIAHIGLYRDHDTLEAVEYFFKAPQDLADRLVIVTDPMLATGNSAVAALERLKARGAHNLRFVCLLAAPEGVAQMQAHHPDVPIWTAAVDKCLNEKGYIVPGLGDAGDRIYGTY
jgi:uracil phosphoribosyltransferase